ncbi:myo-inositol 2-dehydrogenase [Cutibacterium acnes JCM 18918]|nr:myo-inositol 2-dehydrogenase [Cutibacterium acnes JCM 18918]
MSALSQPATSQRHPLSVAVIGAGMAGRTHANAWRQVGTVFGSEGIPPIRLAAICDSYEPFARSARDSYGYERAVTDWHDIVDADDIDVVSVVVSNALHRQVAEDLVRAGKHVLCEKPLSDSLKNARAMAELEANSQVVTGVGFSYRRHPSVAAIAELVRQGRLGDVTTFSGRYWCGYGVDPTVPMAWRYRGPQARALGDLGSHIIDVAEFVCGPIRSVRGGAFATIIDKRPPALEGVAGGRGMTVSAQAIETVENDDIAVFNMTFESGAIGTIVVSRVAFGLPNSMEFDVFGTQGRASFDLARSGEIIVDDTSTQKDSAGLVKYCPIQLSPITRVDHPWILLVLAALRSNNLPIKRGLSSTRSWGWTKGFLWCRPSRTGTEQCVSPMPSLDLRRPVGKPLISPDTTVITYPLQKLGVRHVHEYRGLHRLSP